MMSHHILAVEIDHRHAALRAEAHAQRQARQFRKAQARQSRQAEAGRARAAAPARRRSRVMIGRWIAVVQRQSSAP